MEKSSFETRPKPLLKCPSRPGETHQRLFTCSNCGIVSAICIPKEQGYACPTCGRLSGPHVKRNLTKDEISKYKRFVENKQTLCAYCPELKCKGCGIKGKKIIT